MGSIELQRRPLFGIGTVARLTGVKPDTLRIWQRRYQLGASHRSSSGRRLFTQADLEHLQLVAALVASGTRIGEIASSDRRTLEMLLRASSKRDSIEVPERKPRVVFVGDALCEWLDDHQGCLVNVDALLLPCKPEEMDARYFDGIGAVDGLVVDVVVQGQSTLDSVSSLSTALAVSNVLVLYRLNSESWLHQVKQRGYSASKYPPDPARLVAHLTLSAATAESREGSRDLGQLANGKPRLFSESELVEAREMQSALQCECPRRITDLVRALASFEEYSASCAVKNWEDASVHACIYAYTGQARWLMEKALRLVTEAHVASAVE